MKKEKVSKVLDWLSDTYNVRNLLIHKKGGKSYAYRCLCTGTTIIWK